MQRLRNPETASGPWAWALGRLGARVPVYGSSHQVVPAGQAERWLSGLLAIGLSASDGAAFAVVQLSRRTGDRARDLDDTLRGRALDALNVAAAPERWLRQLEQVVELDQSDDAQALGDSLPLGLRLHHPG